MTGHGVQHAYQHVHDLVAFAVSAFNISHRINAVSFGEVFPVSRQADKQSCNMHCLQVF